MTILVPSQSENKKHLRGYTKIAILIEGYLNCFTKNLVFFSFLVRNSQFLASLALHLGVINNLHLNMLVTSSFVNPSPVNILLSCNHPISYPQLSNKFLLIGRLLVKYTFMYLLTLYSYRITPSYIVCTKMTNLREFQIMITRFRTYITRL